ncbi:RNA polymerase sigma factor [Gimesia aquarii]|uniref:RNA polymerase sigma factor YlaC n=1 Tax=Gimesia aquarii TaxID=2527964 RepID=A0A517WQR7_9PLAN|nr:sigma-70 family RNA polymerase sigma factor [Gimesia aquarii]QDU07599.1 RNA polymerase sigma factor YlaC [Gimesia aquarii]
MTSTDFPLLNDPPSDVPVRQASKERRSVRQQEAIGNRQVSQKKVNKNAQSEAHSESVIQEEHHFILLLLKRDPCAWRDFVTRYDKLIISRILSTCREFGMNPLPDLVEDCGAEVMAALFQGDMRGLRQFQGRSKLSTWLAVITRRTTLNFLRHQQRTAKKIQPNDSQFDIATIPDKPLQETHPVEADERVQIQSCMNQLKQTDRQVLVLYFDQKLSYAEIGQALGISENAVGPKLYRAQQRLKKLVKTRNKQI